MDADVGGKMTADARAAATADRSAASLRAGRRVNNLPHITLLILSFCLALSAQNRNAPLMQAAAFGDAAKVASLLDAGADPNGRNPFDATALIWAAADEAKVRLLLAKGADVNATSRLGRTPLMIAAACDGCSGIVKLLLAKGADPKAQSKDGVTPLALAAAAGDAESVRLLLDAGADANAGSTSGFTPLMQALTMCNPEAVHLLLAHHAAVNAANTSGGTVKFGPIALVHLTALHYAAPYCTVDVVRALLDAGAEPNARDIRQMTPLMLAVGSETQDAAVVRVLIHAGADVTAKSKAGETALDWARKYGSKDVMAQLTAAGAWEPEPPPAPEHRRAQPMTAAASTTAATALLERSATEFFRQSGCVGCHHQSMTLAAVSAARTAAAPVDEAAARDLVRMIASEWTGMQEQLLERFDPGGLADGEVYAAWALSLNHYPASPLTDTVAVHVAALQHRDGRWHVGDASRSPIQESDLARTARAVYTLQKYAPAGRRREFDDRIARARDWMSQTLAVTNDDAAMQIAGLAWAGAPRDRVTVLARKLIAAQRSDGGWAQNPNLPSDAFATGETLWALRESRVLQPSDAVYRRGVEYLLATQFDDGSWHVRSRAPQFQPYFQSGFPYGPDQWVSSAATAWAVLALAPAM
jgi:ankyrin repeat protein